MDLNIFNNLDNTTEKNTNENIEELKELIEKKSPNAEDDKNLEINENRKEGHLYLVTEDRNGEVYLWDFTEKAEFEFVESNLSSEVLAFATEGAMLQYKDGKYILYSPVGYDLMDAEEEI